MLDKLSDLIIEIKKHITAEDYYDSHSDARKIFTTLGERSWVTEDKLFCPACMQERFFQIDVLKHTGVLSKLCDMTEPVFNALTNNYKTASLLSFTCQQCGLNLIGLVINSTSPKYYLLQTSRGNRKTPNAPERVLYFVDQAQRCLLASAHGAAVAAYRVAIEQILYEQGYKNGMLNEKIEDLAAKIANGTAKNWELDWDDELLHVLRKIGNLIIHPKNIAALIEADEELAYSAKAVVEFMLHDIYELPAENKEVKDIVESTKAKL